MYKILFFCVLVASLVSCTCDNYEVRRSEISKIGAVGDYRVLYLANGDTIQSNSTAAFDAFPGDSVEYSRGCSKIWAVTVLFSKERQNLPSKREKEKSSSRQVIFYPLPN